MIFTTHLSIFVAIDYQVIINRPYKLKAPSLTPQVRLPTTYNHYSTCSLKSLRWNGQKVQKIRYFSHVWWPIGNKCWPKVNTCYLFRIFDRSMFENVCELSPDESSCLEKKLWQFEVLSFLNFWKMGKSPRSIFRPKG